MSDDTSGPLSNVITIDGVVRGTVEETLNALLDAEADRLCHAQRHERNAAHRDTRAAHYAQGDPASGRHLPTAVRVVAGECPLLPLRPRHY
jgi:hypothetical protein